MTTEMLTPKELADYLQVSVNTLRRWREQGIGPACLSLGPRVFRYRMDDVKEWEQEIRDGQ